MINICKGKIVAKSMWVTVKLGMPVIAPCTPSARLPANATIHTNTHAHAHTYTYTHTYRVAYTLVHMQGVVSSFQSQGPANYVPV